MSRAIPVPPKLTRDLTRAIAEKIEDARAGNGPASPLDWVAARAGVKKLTVRRWIREANGIRRSASTGPVADAWIAFVDAVDELVSVCSDAVCQSIGEIAADLDHKKALDALLSLQKRIDRQEATMDAADLDIETSADVKHMSQDLLDLLSDDEVAGLLIAQEQIAAAQDRVEAFLSAAAERLAPPAD